MESLIYYNILMNIYSHRPFFCYLLLWHCVAMMGSFLFPTLSRLVLGSTQPPILWVLGGTAVGVWSWPPPSRAEFKNVWSYTSTP